MVRLSPELDLALIAKIPAVAHNSMLTGRLAGQVGRLRRASHRWDLRPDGSLLSVTAPAAETGGMGANESIGEANDVNDNGFLHRFREL